MIAGDYKEEVFVGDDFGGYQEVSKDSFDMAFSNIKRELDEKRSANIIFTLQVIALIVGLVVYTIWRIN